MMLHRHFAGQEPEEREDRPKELPPLIQPKKRRGRKGKQKKAAVYVGTRNVYHEMVPAAKSLLCHSDVDVIYFWCEDDEFPIPIPKEIVPVNVSGYRSLFEGGPNANTHWSYMCLLRSVYDILIPQHDVILSIDNDTICVDDVSCLWDLDMTEYYYAGVPDLGVRRAPGLPLYINGGVMMINLELQRANHIGEKMKDALNTRYYQFITQDTMDEFCSGRMMEIPLRFNESCVTGRTDNPAIIHFVGVDKKGGSNAQRRHFWNEYEQMSWEEVARLRKERYGMGLTF